MVALDRAIDFACFVWEDGSEGDCTALALAPEERPIVLVAPR
jgi:hypothetical protein